MATAKANTTCRNPNCHNGKDGGQKRYYACAYCRRTESWRAVACCPECYAEYIRLVRIGRGELQEPLPSHISEQEKDELFSESMDEMTAMLGFQPASIADAMEAVNRKLDEGGS